MEKLRSRKVLIQVFKAELASSWGLQTSFVEILPYPIVQKIILHAIANTEILNRLIVRLDEFILKHLKNLAQWFSILAAH